MSGRLVLWLWGALMLLSLVKTVWGPKALHDWWFGLWCGLTISLVIVVFVGSRVRP